LTEEVKYKLKEQRVNGFIVVVDAKTLKPVKKFKTVTGLSKWLVDQGLGPKTGDSFE
jgi:hypothetical protein